MFRRFIPSFPIHSFKEHGSSFQRRTSYESRKQSGAREENTCSRGVVSRATFKFQVRVTRYSPFRFLTLPGHSHLSQLQFLEQRGSRGNGNSFSCNSPMASAFTIEKYWPISRQLCSKDLGSFWDLYFLLLYIIKFVTCHVLYFIVFYFVQWYKNNLYIYIKYNICYLYGFKA